MTILDQMSARFGAEIVATGTDAAPWQQEWTGKFESDPAGVLRPRTTEEVSAILRAANETGTVIVPVSGNTGLNGGTVATGGAVCLSLDRMNAIREIRPDARLAVVEAGVILEQLHSAADAHDLVFPMTFGAKGSARIGGMLSTNAGGSNVVRYGGMRELCLGIEVVMPNGEIANLMSEVHKDNSGYDLRNLMIGAEGTLGIITAAVLKLAPKPKAFATAMVAVPDLSAGLALLNRVQLETGGAVEACEYMPRSYMEACMAKTGARAPFDPLPGHMLMIETAATSETDATPGEDGTLPVTERLAGILGAALEDGLATDATIAFSEAQRQEMWARREAAGEVMLHRKPILDTDICLPLDRLPEFFGEMDSRLGALDPGGEATSVAHLGDGNIHYTLYPSSDDAAHIDALREAVEDVAIALGGSFSAEHGIGLSKMPSMRRRKDPVALAVMRQIKAALDPNGILNPGKVLPPSNEG